MATGPNPPRDHRLANRSAQRRSGAFYTQSAATSWLVEWAVRGDRDHVLEPSFGGGAFLAAARHVATTRGWAGLRVTGAELSEADVGEAVRIGLLAPEDAFCGDFLSLPPFPVDVVLGNPPYVRLRHLPGDQEVRARGVAAASLGAPMEASGSVWMPFVLHAMRFLRAEGRLALVLPFELTYVRYARPLWRVLGENFRTLRVMRVHERLFPEILQEVVVLLADGLGGTTPNVEFTAIAAASEFTEATTRPGRSIAIADLLLGRREFMRALLPPPLVDLLTERIDPATVPLGDRCAFRIGYVTGHKAFFHPRDAARRALPASSLRPAVTTSRQLTGLGVRTSALAEPETLFLPTSEGVGLNDGERAYIASGEAQGVHRRYKCTVRAPWYRVPWVEVPDVVLSVFSERPVLVHNDARLVASNSLLCGFLAGGSAEDFLSGWYTSLTPLFYELEVHALGGGVLVLIPGEVARIRVPGTIACPTGHLDGIHRLLVAGDIRGAYALGDEPVLSGIVGLSASEIALIEEGTAVLRWWRTSGRGGE